MGKAVPAEEAALHGLPVPKTVKVGTIAGRPSKPPPPNFTEAHKANSCEVEEDLNSHNRRVHLIGAPALEELEGNLVKEPKAIAEKDLSDHNRKTSAVSAEDTLVHFNEVAVI